MRISRRIKGLLGTALIWGAAGMLIGAAIFVVGYQPWKLGLRQVPRAAQLLGMFMGTAGLWGAACGLAFGVTVTTLGRRACLEQLSRRRIALWGALGGAAFPFALYAPRILGLRGADAAMFFGGLTLGSALVGGGLASLVLRVARRAPETPIEPAALGEAATFEAAGMAVAPRERVT